MRQILEKSWEQNVHVHHLNFDFQVARDTVWRKEMWSEIPEKLVKLCRS
jgi:hypothetical protein